MERPDFNLCEETATKLLAEQNTNHPNINVMKLVYDKNIIFDTLQNYCSLTGIPINSLLCREKQLLNEGCMLYNRESDTYIILYNDKEQSLEHLNWTLAHEIGHIYLGHTVDAGKEEIEAHFFAAQLLMPEYTIYEMVRLYGAVSCDDLSSIFSVSYTAANKRIDTMNRKYSWRAGKLDKKIWGSTKDIIMKYYEFHNKQMRCTEIS